MNAWVTYKTVNVQVPIAKIRLTGVEEKDEVVTGTQKINGKLVKRKIHKSELINLIIIPSTGE